MGAFAGADAAAPLWEYSKRELVELALRLTQEGMAADIPGAVARVQDEHRTLKQSNII